MLDAGQLSTPSETVLAVPRTSGAAVELAPDQHAGRPAGPPGGRAGSCQWSCQGRVRGVSGAVPTVAA